jgi:hypothetical protein
MLELFLSDTKTFVRNQPKKHFEILNCFSRQISLNFPLNQTFQSAKMSGREGGKKKPLKAAKKEGKVS